MIFMKKKRDTGRHTGVYKIKAAWRVGVWGLPWVSINSQPHKQLPQTTSFTEMLVQVFSYLWLLENETNLEVVSLTFLRTEPFR